MRPVSAFAGVLAGADRQGEELVRSHQSLSVFVVAGLAAGLVSPAFGQPQTAVPGRNIGYTSDGVSGDSDVQKFNDAGRSPVALDRLLGPFEDLAAGERLGRRSHAMIDIAEMSATIVVVPSAEAAVAALEGWGPFFRYPVLIDDGTLESAENIARFSRGFEPQALLFWDPEVAPLPSDRAGRIEYLDTVFETMMRADPAAVDAAKSPARARLQTLEDQGFVPHGVVVTDPMDTTVAASLALAGGRLSPIIYSEKLGASPDTRLNSAADWAPMLADITGGLDAMDFEWRGLGDDIDAVAIVMNTASKTKGGSPVTPLAFTDEIIRTDGPYSSRYAWAGQIFGNEQEALYRVMSALTITPDSAFLADGYDMSMPWAMYDMGQAESAASGMGLQTRVMDAPEQSTDDFVAATAPVTQENLILVNSKGLWYGYDMRPGRAFTGDLPLLDRPSVMHIVHSFSAQFPARKDSIAGRMMHNGVFAYYGSSDEPYLTAFCPTPALVERIASGMTYSAATRLDGRFGWKLNYFGDPLFTMHEPGPKGKRVAQAASLDGAETLLGRMQTAQQNGDTAEVIRTFNMMGQDEQTNAVVSQLLGSPGAVTSEVAHEAILGCYREGNYDAVLTLWQALDEQSRSNMLLQDALWYSARVGGVGSPREGEWADAICAALRPGGGHQEAEDLLEASYFVERTQGGEAAAQLLEDNFSKARNNSYRNKFNDRIDDLRG